VHSKDMIEAVQSLEVQHIDYSGMNDESTKVQ
jgi:hypothetical protein